MFAHIFATILFIVSVFWAVGSMYFTFRKREGGEAEGLKTSAIVAMAFAIIAIAAKYIFG